MRPTRSACGILMAAVILAVTAATGTSRTEVPDRLDWPGWRGATGGGTVVEPLPRTWSAIDHIAWKTMIPGRGYSSPIVAGSSAYVTTAYEAASGKTLVAVAAILEVAALLLLTGVVAVRACRDGVATPVSAPWAFPRATLAFAMLFGVALIVLFGPALMDFQRCTIRGWIASSGVMTACLIVAGSALPAGALRSRLGLGVIGLAFGLLVLLGFPAKDHAFREGMTGVRGQIAFASAGVPIAIGLFLALRTRPSAVTQQVLRVLAGLAVVAAAVLTWQIATFEGPTFDHLAGSLPVTGVSRALAIASLVLLTSVGAWWSTRAPYAGVVLSASLAAWVLVASTWALDRFAGWAPYIAYQIGAPKWQLHLGPAALAAAAATALLAARTMRAGWLRGVSLGAWIATLSLGLGTAHFARVNAITASPTLVRAIVAVDRESGAVQWIAEGLAGPDTAVDRRNSAATPTPVTDGKRICAYFGTGLMCATPAGSVLWSRPDIGAPTYYGAGASPVLADTRLIVAHERAGAARLLSISALDVSTGRTLWSSDLPGALTDSGIHRTPLVTRGAVIYRSPTALRAFRIEDGRQVWQYASDSTGDQVSGLLTDGARIWMGDNDGIMALDAARLEGQEDPLLWKTPGRVNVVSPVRCGDLIMAVTDTGILSAMNSTSGTIRWRHRLSGEFRGSPVASDRAAYFTNTAGLTSVVGCGDTFESLATNDLGEETLASPAAAAGALFFRTAGHLIRIGR